MFRCSIIGVCRIGRFHVQFNSKRAGVAQIGRHAELSRPLG